MSSIDSIQFISVESRKGGVGKTTVSLALAQTLLSKGYQVLILDLDLTGTRIGDSFTRQHSFINMVQFKGEPLNLVDLYKNYYLKGHRLPELGDLNLDKTRCNYISSDIYCGKDYQPIQDPRVLMDTLHAYWMRKLVLQLAGSYSSFVKQDGGHGFFIIDNAPGFSSLETMVHEMLTTIGPEQGKFLLVSSADDQDWKAICQSSSLIRHMLEDKVNGAFYYNSLCNNGKSKKDDSIYFEEIWKELCLTNGKDPVYFSKVKLMPQPSQYIQIIINKIPEGSVFSPILDPDINATTLPFSLSLSTFFSTLLSKEDTLRNDEDYLSGEILRIIEDDSIFMKRFVNHRFFSRIKQYRPIESFIMISDYYSGQESDVLPVGPALREASDSPEVQASLDGNKEETFVRQFIHSITNDKDVDMILDEAVFLLKQEEGHYPLVLQTEKLHLLHLAEPIMLAGKAIYYLKNYSLICQLLNDLIKGASLDLDFERICSLVERILEGEIGFSADFWDNWKGLLAKEMNLDSLKRQMGSVLKNWGI